MGRRDRRVSGHRRQARTAKRSKRRRKANVYHWEEFSRRKERSGNPFEHVIFMVDNRPGGLNLYHKNIGNAAEIMRGLEGGMIPQDLPFTEVPDELLRARIEAGLKSGAFRDRDKVREWMHLANSWADWKSVGLAPLTLVHVHAESDIAELVKRVVEDNHRPAGIVLSGSPKMLNEVLKTPVMQKTLELIDYALKQEVPTLGICFGMHLLTYARYRILVDWLRVPDKMHVQFHRGLGRFSRVEPGQKWQVYGVERLRDVVHCDFMNGVDKGTQILEVHSTYVAPQRLYDIGHGSSILAVSRRRFRQGLNASAGVVQHIVEVLECGPVAYGTQLHPELTPDLLLVLTYIPAYKEFLELEGHDIELIRNQLRNYPADSYFAGARMGYNFIKRILAVDRITRAVESGRIAGREARKLLHRLERRSRYAA